MSCTHPKMDCDGVQLDEGLYIVSRLIMGHRGIAITDGCHGDLTSDPPTPTYVICPKMEDAVELMLHVAHLTNYHLGDNIALTIHPPLPESTIAQAKVSWVPELTGLLVKNWA